MRGRLLKALKSRRREKIPLAPQLCLQKHREIGVVEKTLPVNSEMPRKTWREERITTASNDRRIVPPIVCK